MNTVAQIILIVCLTAAITSATFFMLDMIAWLLDLLSYWLNDRKTHLEIPVKMLVSLAVLLSCLAYIAWFIRYNYA